MHLIPTYIRLGRNSEKKNMLNVSKVEAKKKKKTVNSRDSVGGENVGTRWLRMDSLINPL